MAQYGLRYLQEPIRSIAFGDIPAAYDISNTMQDANNVIALQHPARFIVIHNVTNQPLMFSMNGTDDHIYVYTSSAQIRDIASNKQNNNSMFMGNGEVLYVRYIDSAPTSGDVFFEVAYAKGD